MSNSDQITATFLGGDMDPEARVYLVLIGVMCLAFIVTAASAIHYRAEASRERRRATNAADRANEAMAREFAALTGRRVPPSRDSDLGPHYRETPGAQPTQRPAQQARPDTTMPRQGGGRHEALTVMMDAVPGPGSVPTPVIGQPGRQS